MELTDFLFEKTNGLARLTFNRPEKLNAFRRKSRSELLRILAEVKADHSVRVVVLSGAGRAFCAGVDLSELSVSLEAKSDLREERMELRELQQITRRIAELGKPVLAAINGPAVGLGVEMALACDIRIASTRATFSFAEAKRGLFQTNGVTYLLPRLVGFGRAMELMMTGRTVEGPEAASLGLVSDCLPPEAFEEKVAAVAATLAGNAPLSLQLIKSVGRRALDTGLEEAMEMEVEGMIECLRSEDIREGVRAFMEKRKPNFKGK